MKSAPTGGNINSAYTGAPIQEHVLCLLRLGTYDWPTSEGT
jgi:hypothetical protein